MRQSQLDALAGLALAPDNLADMRQLFRHPLVGGDDLVERVGDLAGEPGAVVGQAHREIAEANGLQRVQYVAQIEIVLGLRPGPVSVRTERRDDPCLDRRRRLHFGTDFG